MLIICNIKAYEEKHRIFIAIKTNVKTKENCGNKMMRISIVLSVFTFGKCCTFTLPVILQIQIVLKAYFLLIVELRLLMFPHIVTILHVASIMKISLY